ncbi:hypothetical protein J1M35_15055 [Ottowia testudinis]|uniref:DUF2059 domain-containing protein n=2 Tax=Ottowia testudinis TaxID=2816950 RepID=A0A975CEP7_9BURK|nr:DUF2059 domain-containing protein [Ottowia testudinis]QTD44406.1 hypothetical protein J1M35_15055 [Ottowia testudinis]
MKIMLNRLPAAIIMVAACALSTSAVAQNDSKRALAAKLAQIQLKADGPAMAEQLTGSAVQPILANWSQRLDETVPPARQKEVRDKLDVELKKFAESTHKAIEAQVGKSAEAALVPVFMEKLSEDEMKTIITYLESPVSAKFQSLGPDATNAWAKRIVDATKSSVESGVKSFDAAAGRIVGTASGGAAPAKK